MLEDLNDPEVKPFIRFLVANAIIKHISRLNYYEKYHYEDIFDLIFPILLNQELEIDEIRQILEKAE